MGCAPSKLPNHEEQVEAKAGQFLPTRSRLLSAHSILCAVNNAINIQIKQDQENRRNVIQVLLLGAGESGKVCALFVSWNC